MSEPVNDWEHPNAVLFNGFAHGSYCGWGYWGRIDDFCDLPPGHTGKHKGER